MGFRKRVWKDVGGFSTRFSICWDFDFALRLCLRRWPVVYTPQTVYYSRVHDSNLQRADGGIRLICESARALADGLRNPLFPREWRPALLDVLRPKLTSAAYWERRRGNFGDALRLYLLALQHGVDFREAIKGIPKVGVAASLRLLHASRPNFVDATTTLRKATLGSSQRA
jgi:hypothetical protein